MLSNTGAYLFHLYRHRHAPKTSFDCKLGEINRINANA